MKSIDIKINSLIKTKGFDISIGQRIDQIALISHSTGEFTSFLNIKKGGRLSKIKRIFKNKLSSSTHFFFEGMNELDVKKLFNLLSQ